MHKPFCMTLVSISVSLCIILSACWIPESFDAKIAINKDGSYTFTYDGILAFALAVAAAKDRALSVNDEAQLRKEADNLRREPGFKNVEYQGKGRYKVLFDKSGNAGETFYFLSREMRIFAILPQQDGSIVVSAVRPKQEELQQLNSIGAKIDGSLSVSVANGIKVVRHNADSQPIFFGLVGAYKWQIRSPDANPLIVVQPSS